MPSRMASEGAKGDPRWRVAILDDHERSRAALRAAIWAAGGEVVGEAVRCADAPALVQRATPDVAVCAVGLPDGDGVEVARQLIEAGCVALRWTAAAPWSTSPELCSCQSQSPPTCLHIEHSPGLTGRQRPEKKHIAFPVRPLLVPRPACGQRRPREARQ